MSCFLELMTLSTPTLKAESWDWQPSLAAFLGAGFSFLFLLWFDRLERERNRKKEGNKALVVVEHLANRTIYLADKNRYILRKAIDRAGQGRKNRELAVSILCLRALEEIPLGVITDLLSVDVLNRAFGINMIVGTITSDGEKLDLLISRSLLPYDKQTLNREEEIEFWRAYDNVTVKMKEIAAGYEGIILEAMELFAAAKLTRRITKENRSIVDKIVAPRLSGWNDEMQKEVEKLRNNIRETRKIPTVYDRGIELGEDIWGEEND